MAGPYLWLRVELEPAVKGALGTTVDWPWSCLVPRNLPSGWPGHPPYWQGFRVRTEQGMGSV